MASSDFKYHARHALVSAKRGLGLSTRPDKTFFVERLSRLLRSGKVGQRCRVMALGKDDGAGSQALCEMSAMNFAAAHGITHAHRPMTTIEHAEMAPEAWVALWEGYFNLGAAAPSQLELGLPVIPIETFLSKRALWDADVIVSAEHFLHFARLEPRSWLGVRNDLRGLFKGSYAPPRAAAEPIAVALHVRRGDVSAASTATRSSFTPSAAFMRTLDGIEAAVQRAGARHVVELHSQGSPELFAEFAARGCRLMLDTPALETHRRLASADVLAMSQSAFSYTAGLLGRGAVLYDPQKYPALADWIVRERDGGFDVDALARRLERIGQERSGS